MNELLLYAIIKAVLTQSYVIEGRFIVAEGYGNDLNTNNYGDIIKDALSNYAQAQPKFPISVLMPPVEIIDSFDIGRSRFKLDHFFLCTTGYTGQGEIKEPNILTNVSEHPVIYDWKDMREVAGDYHKALDIAIQNAGYRMYITSASDTKTYVRRVSGMGNDKLAGVMLSYEMNVNMPCELHDYSDVNAITLPAISEIHSKHKH